MSTWREGERNGKRRDKGEEGKRRENKSKSKRVRRGPAAPFIV